MKLASGLHFRPVVVKLVLMQINPFADQPDSGPGTDVPAKNVTTKVKHRFFSLMLSVEVRRVVFVEEHLDHDP